MTFLMSSVSTMKDGPAQPFSFLTDAGTLFDSPGADYKWIVDPIDGTRHFKRGLPLFATTAALCFKEKPVATIVYVPVTAELFFAIEGFGAYLNNWESRLEVTHSQLRDAMLHLEFPNQTLATKNPQEFQQMSGNVSHLMKVAYRIRGLGVGSLGLAYVAKGVFAGYVSLPSTTEWTDVAAGILLVKEAGGKVCIQDCPGLTQYGVRVIASNKECFNPLKSSIQVPGVWRNV